MPFTLAHPAAALPIHRAGRGRLRFAALAIGATTPDYQYFLHLDTVGGFTHSLPGLFLVCLPAGWLSLWLFDRFGRRGVQALLPEAWSLPPVSPRANDFLPVSVALLLGALSHIVWDSITHANGWAVSVAPTLKRTIQIGPFAVPGFEILQHVSTLLGLAALAWVSWRWARRQPEAPARELAGKALVVLAILGLAGAMSGLRFRSDGLPHFVVAAGVAVSLTLGLGLVALGALTPAE